MILEYLSEVVDEYELSEEELNACLEQFLFEDYIISLFQEGCISHRDFLFCIENKLISNETMSRVSNLLTPEQLSNFSGIAPDYLKYIFGGINQSMKRNESITTTLLNNSKYNTITKPDKQVSNKNDKCKDYSVYDNKSISKLSDKVKAKITKSSNVKELALKGLGKSFKDNK